jgi:hypothetical protein
VTDPRAYEELEAAFAGLAVDLFAVGSVEVTLQRVVDLALQTVDGCDLAAVLLQDGAGPTIAASSGADATALEWSQVEAGEGPGFEASAEGAGSHASDLVDDDRWPAFSAVAGRLGVRSVVVFPLSSSRAGRLSLYGRLPAAFGAIDRARGHLLATLAGLALDSASDRAADLLRVDNLREALRTRELIGQAQGILMERERIGADEAFDVLRRASQHVNVKLREVAQTLVDTGVSPDVGREPKPRG